MKTTSTYFNTAIENAALEAGEYLRKEFESRGGNGHSYKNGNPLGIVTDQDKRAEQIIKASLRKVFKDLAFVGEEFGREGSDLSTYVAYIDPIDGTTNFAHGVPQFTTLISIYDREKKNVVASVIYDPIRRKMYSAALDGKDHYQLYYNTNKIKPVPRNPDDSAEMLHISTIGHCLNRGYLNDSEYELVHKVNADLERQHQMRIRNSGSSGYDTISMIETLLQGHPSACLARGGAAWDFLASLPFAKALGGTFAMPSDPAREIWQARVEQVTRMRADKDNAQERYFDWITWGDTAMVEKIQSTIRMAYKEQAKQSARGK